MKLSLLLWLASILPQPVADRACLAGTIYLEARSEPLAGQLAVAEVALRRADSGQWGNSVCSVLTAPGQFAFSITPRSYVLGEADALQRSWAIANIAMANWSLPSDLRYSVVPRADHFYATNTPMPDWARGYPLARIGDHSFYRVD
ncbi:MAG: cell wall hydrolase [Proteobacteria bacterium]|uniref:cell wall hydrolase n=1 Tax=Rudaea sp. TaxID=2136325 RepID=UPI001DC4C120|nr:cell wall hydrolase [Pseudomonadota bacterium]MBS0567463.1 cell wall hydrolase [Pseudomonadota bacterium]